MNLKIVKRIYIFLAFIFLGIGMIGVVIPILPTTPFLLLSSALFAKGSDKFNDWFKSTKIYKDHLEDFVATRSMTLKKKLCILLPVSALLITTYILMDNLHGRIAIIGAIIFKYYYFFAHIKTSKNEELSIRKETI